MKNVIITFAMFITISLTVIAQGNHSGSFTKFELAIEDGVTFLEWESTQEINTATYLIEKSNDGDLFTIIGTQKAGSSTYATSYYSFEDTDVNSDTVWYKITLVFMDGTRLSSVYQFNSDQNYFYAMEDEK